MGNLRSVAKAMAGLGFAVQITGDSQNIRRAGGVILPGVGAFADAMDNLRALELVDVLRREAVSGKPFLGICLGMQLLMSGSEENGWHRGLGVIPGPVRRFQGDLKVPHMGWNQLQLKQPDQLFAGIENGTYFYFVHSYYVEPEDQQWLLATADYGREFAAAVGRNNLYGVQFHPEKSSLKGLRILENFGKLVESC